MKNEMNALIMEAMKNHDSVRTETLRAIKSAFLNWQTSKENAGKELTDADEIQIIKKMLCHEEQKSQRKKWLILTALGCNILALCAGISYNHISCCPTIGPFYLSGVYPMILLFEVLGILWGSREGYRLFQRHKGSTGSDVCEENRNEAK